MDVLKYLQIGKKDFRSIKLTLCHRFPNISYLNCSFGALGHVKTFIYLHFHWERTTMQNWTLLVSFNRKRLSWWKAECCQCDLCHCSEWWPLTCLEREGMQRNAGVLSGLSWGIAEVLFKESSSPPAQPRSLRKASQGLSSPSTSSPNIQSPMAAEINLLSIWQRRGGEGMFNCFSSHSQKCLSLLPWTFCLSGGRY